TVAGFSLLSYVSSTYNGFFFVSLDPWDQREGNGRSAKELAAKLNDAFKAQIPEATVFAFLPPAIPGLGTPGGFSLWVQAKSGGSVEYLNQNLQKFLEAARKRPELQNVNSSFRGA